MEDVQEYLLEDAQEYLLDEKGGGCQTPFRRNQPLLRLQWLKKTRSIKKINQSGSMTLVILMLLIISGDVELNPGPTASTSFITDEPKADHCAQRFYTACSSCNHLVHVRQRKCKHCGFALQRRAGRPTGTTAEAGFHVSMFGAGFDVSKSGGRLIGTTAAPGFNVCW